MPCALFLDPGPASESRPPWWRPSLALALTLILVAALVWFGLPHLSELLGFAKKETGSPESAPPSAFRSSSRAPGHPAGAAFDGFNNRYWAPKKLGAGVDEYLECDFDQPVRVMKLIVFSDPNILKKGFRSQMFIYEFSETENSPGENTSWEEGVSRTRDGRLSRV